MSISAIIVNYHTASYISDIVKDLLIEKEIGKIFIVDNSGELIYEEIVNRIVDYPINPTAKEIYLLKPDSNIGFGAGVNLAASKASSKYLLVINPDVRLFPDCIYHLIESAEKYGAVLTGPRFFWDKDKKYKLPPSQGAAASLDYAYEVSSKNRLEFEHLSFYWQMRHERFWNAAEPFPELFLSGACVLINREWAINNNLSSLFDERFFLYFEDNDISLRAFFDGIPPLCIPQAEALHHYDQSPQPEEGKWSLMAKSHALFAQKYYGDLKFSLAKTDNYSAGYLPKITDIGLLESPFSFDLSDFKLSFQNLYFEIGVNPFFVPFAQTEIDMQNKNDLTDDNLNIIDKLKAIPKNKERNSFNKCGYIFKIDNDIWNKLAKGVYYTRVRDSIKGTLKIWKWEKR